MAEAQGVIGVPILNDWCASGPAPRDPICDETLPLSKRLALMENAHPTAFCRRDRVGIVAALQEIDALKTQVAMLASRLGVEPKELLRDGH